MVEAATIKREEGSGRIEKKEKCEGRGRKKRKPYCYIPFTAVYQSPPPYTPLRKVLY
jgi:hypothetical protein